VLADSEREAVADLLGFLENVHNPRHIHRKAAHTDCLQRAETDFFTGEPLRALSTLVYSDNIDLQRSASLTFAEITERDVREVDQETLGPILFLLQNPDIEVQRAASAALGNLAVNSMLSLRNVQAHADPHSGEQGRHCVTGRTGAANQANELAQCRGAMQRRRLYHKPSHPRRQQSEDSSLRRTAAPYTVSQVERYARAEECNGRTVEHDTLRYAWLTVLTCLC
jgi:hypothetical protein